MGLVRLEDEDMNFDSSAWNPNSQAIAERTLPDGSVFEFSGSVDSHWPIVNGGDVGGAASAESYPASSSNDYTRGSFSRNGSTSSTDQSSSSSSQLYASPQPAGSLPCSSSASLVRPNRPLQKLDLPRPSQHNLMMQAMLNSSIPRIPSHEIMHECCEPVPMLAPEELAPVPAYDNFLSNPELNEEYPQWDMTSY